MKGSPFESKAGAFSIFLHFTAVVILSTTWNDLMFSAVWTRQTFNFLFQFSNRPHQFYSRIVYTVFLLNDWEKARDNRGKVKLSLPMTSLLLSKSVLLKLPYITFSWTRKTYCQLANNITNCNCRTDPTQASLFFFITNLKNIRQTSVL